MSSPGQRPPFRQAARRSPAGGPLRSLPSSFTIVDKASGDYTAFMEIFSSDAHIPGSAACAPGDASNLWIYFLRLRFPKKPSSCSCRASFPSMVSPKARSASFCASVRLVGTVTFTVTN